MKSNISQRVVAFTLVVALTTAVGVVRGDSFGSGENAFDIEFVAIGALGNAADTTGDPNPAGAVPYAYRMGVHAISTDMVSKANDEGALGISFDRRDADRPATGVSWFGAAIFTNWLNTSSGHEPAYKFSEQGDFALWQPGDAGYDPANPYRSTLAHYFLPSTDEYYKAAFYDPAAQVYYDYPTGSDDEPTAVASGTSPGSAVYAQADLDSEPAAITLAGGLSPFGTMGQGGNTWEWHESEVIQPNDNPGLDEGRVVRGGSWQGPVGALGSDSINPNNPPPVAEFPDLGFRVASVPEPSSLALVMLGIAVICIGERRSRTQARAGLGGVAGPG